MLDSPGSIITSQKLQVDLRYKYIGELERHPITV